MIRVVVSGLVVALVAAGGGRAAGVSRQQAEAFLRKVAQIRQHGETSSRPGSRRTPITEAEVNSWFAYHAQPFLPAGVTQPAVTIVGGGTVAGRAIVDLDAVGRRRAGGGAFDPWKLLGGRLPVTVSGVLHTRDGRGRFELRSAEISGIPVPASLLQELVSYYSRSPERPQGVRIDEPFDLPANIQTIEVGRAQAVVVQ